MSQDKVIMFESADAAELKTVTGWVSSSGRFWGADEAMARFDGATHRQCKNNPDHPIHKVRGYCHACHEERRAEFFTKMPFKDWEGEPLVIFDDDRYFFDEDSLMDYLLDEEIDVNELRLCICEPNMPREIEPDDIFCDDLPEDGEIRDDDLLAAFELLNEMIRKSGPLSWSEGKYAARLPQSFLARLQATRKSEV